MFWKTKEKPKKKRVTHAPKTLDQILSDALNKEVNRDPELRRELAYRKAGYTDLLKKKDPIEEKKKELKDKMTTRAFEKIDQDPELSEKFVDQQVSEIMGSSGEEEIDNEKFDDDGNPIHRILQQKQDLEELEEQFGGGGGRSTLVRDVLDSEFGKTLAAIVAQLFVNASPKAQSPAERVYIIDVPGKGMAEVPEGKYRELLQAGQIKPTGMLLENKAEPTPQASPKPEVRITPPDIGPTLPKEFDMIDIPMFGAFLAQSPEEVVEQLKNQVLVGDIQSKYLWDFISSTDYDIIVSIIKPYSKNPRVGEYVQQLLSHKGKEWAELVIKLVKDNKSET